MRIDVEIRLDDGVGYSRTLNRDVLRYAYVMPTPEEDELRRIRPPLDQFDTFRYQERMAKRRRFVEQIASNIAGAMLTALEKEDAA